MVDLAAARAALRSHSLSALFTQSLNWSAPDTTVEPISPLNQTCIPIASRNASRAWQRAWQIVLTEKTRFTSALRSQLYSAICAYEQTLTTTTATSTAPLVIVVDALKTRSLWCSSASESALYVVGQPVALWNTRLRRLATGGGLYPSFNADESCFDEGRERFETLLVELRESIYGIEDITHQQSYAALTLQRLMLIQQIQQKGWLANDVWYLQSRFGQQSQHENGGTHFFETCLQPLYQSLALPKRERPVALQATVGEVPFIGGLFYTHRLEAAYARISIGDAALEDVLGWLSEQMSVDGFNPWLSGALGYWLSRSADGQRGNGRRGDGRRMNPALGRAVCDHTLDALIQQRLEHAPIATSQTLNDQLFNADAQLCRHLIQEVLPALRILDPACGSGELLVAFHQRLTEIFSIITGYIQQNQDAQLKIWRSGLVETPEPEMPAPETPKPETPKAEISEDKSGAEPTENFVQTFQKRILSNLLYGVDSSDDAVESARLHLLMHLVGTAIEPREIEPLLDLDFNLLAGNALVGFITVDEERFDQINRTGHERILQGNLLQPLAADSYQMVLSEKNITLEHYQSRTVLLGQAHNVPSYARAALLKEEILALDQKAQKKLDRLLLNYMSQQLGIRYRGTQLVGKPCHRPLIQQDIEKLQPFHFGYHFHTIVKNGGFDIVACYPPQGTFHSTVADFIQQFPTLSQRASINEKTFRTSKPALAKIDSQVSATWLSYRDQFAYTADYFQRSELYAHQRLAGEGRGRSQLAIERLFVERCLHLLNSEGLGAAMVPAASFQDPKAASLYSLLQSSKRFVELTCDSHTPGQLLIIWSK
ncbi:MAG: hypothetical protein AAF716_01620 [Cyanobacteria bacterium P01_D01_bin.1]